MDQTILKRDGEWTTFSSTYFLNVLENSFFGLWNEANAGKD